MAAEVNHIAAVEITFAVTKDGVMNVHIQPIAGGRLRVRLDHQLLWEGTARRASKGDSTKHHLRGPL